MTASRTLSFGELIRRGIGALRGGLLMIGVLTLIASAVAVAGPRIASGVLRDELSFRMTTASANTLDLQASVDPIPSTSGEGFVDAVAKTWAAFDSELPLVRNRMPGALHAVTTAGRFVGRDDGSTHTGIPASGAPHGPPKRVLTLSLEANPGLRSDAALVSGTWPAAAVDDPAAPLAVVVSEQTADELQWRLGEVQTLSSFNQHGQKIVLVGTLRPRHPNADYWQLDSTRAKASSVASTDGDVTTFHGVIWMAPQSWPAISWQFGGAAIRSWFPVDATRITPDNLKRVQSSLSLFTSSAQTVGSGADAVQPRFTSNFSLAANSYLDRAGGASGVLSVIDAGPLGTAGALLLLAVSLLVERRRAAGRLQRARGASSHQLRAELAGQLAVATAPGAVLGVLIGVLISPGAFSVGLLGVAAAAAAVPLVVGVVQLAPPAAEHLGLKGLRRARLVFDGILLLLAALDVLLLVQRGLAGQAPGLTADPLLTVTPIVLSAAGCALALRALPPALRALGRVVRRGRGAVALIGRANSARAGARFLPVFATVTGVAIALFASSILATQQKGLTDAGVGQIGSDIRISAGDVSEARIETLRSLPGVTGLAVVSTIAGTRVAGHSEGFAVFVVDHRQLAAVEADLSPQKHRFPLLGTERGGRPVAYGGGFLQPLDARSALEGSVPLPVSMIEDDDPAPKFVSNSPWVLLDLGAVSAAERGLALQDSVLIRVAPGADPDRVTRGIRSVIGPGPLITSALDRVHDLSASPLVTGLTNVALAAIALSVVFSVLALLLALLMNAAARAVLLERVRALGLARRQAIGLIGWELGPMVVLGALVGAVLGVLVALLFLSVVDLSTFVGGTSPPVPSIDPVLALGSLAVFVLSAAIATLVASLVATRPSSSSTRRIRELDPS